MTRRNIDSCFCFYLERDAFLSVRTSGYLNQTGHPHHNMIILDYIDVWKIVDK